MPTPPSLTYVGQLVASPYARELAAAEPLTPLLLAESDYVSCKDFETDAPHPVLLAYTQHYRVIEDLVVRALAQLPSLRHVLVRFHTVCLRPLPPGLVQPRVLLVDDPRRLAAEMLAEDDPGDILVIDDRLRRDTREPGDNTLAVTLHAAAPDRERFASLLAGADFYRGTAAPLAPPVLDDATPPSPSMNYAHHYGTLVTDALEQISPLPRRLHADLHRAALGLLDSALIIEEPCTSFERKPSEIASTLQADERFTTGLDRIAAAVEADGLAPHYMAIMREFATAMFSLFASAEQLAQVRAWVAGGSLSSFLMTDAGGPSPAHWKTQVREVEGALVLSVDKVWAMGSDADLFAIVAAAVPNGIYPAAFLLSPEQCRHFRRTESGPPLLEGVIRLQNVKGRVEVHDAQKLTRGGPTMLNRLLTIVRPQLVRCLMAHVKWLAHAGRVTLDGDARKAVETIQAIASHLAAQPYGNAVVTQVLATKFASNELLHQLVADGAVHRTADQRDLLAFTKMEGSSYRCLREIYAKAYAYNRPAVTGVA